MLNIVSGLVKPTKGKILFDEIDVTNLITEKKYRSSIPISSNL